MSISCGGNVIACDMGWYIVDWDLLKVPWCFFEGFDLQYCQEKLMGVRPSGAGFSLVLIFPLFRVATAS